jgi:hypothetical protein
LIAGGSLVVLGLAIGLVLVPLLRTPRSATPASDAAPAPAETGTPAAELRATAGAGDDVAEGVAVAGERATQRSALAADAHAPGAERSGAFVRLITADGHGPFARASVHLVLGALGELVAESAVAESDESGLIDLARRVRGSPPERELSFSSHGCRLRFEPASLTVGTLGRTPADAPQLVVSVRPAAILRGRALDIAGDEPLTELALRLTSWMPLPSAGTLAASSAQRDHPCLWMLDQPWMVTDASGRFESAETVPLGFLSLVTPGGEEAEVVLAAPDTPVEARFRVGPRILLAFDPPGGRTTSDFLAALYRDPFEAEELQEPTSPWSPAGLKRDWGNAVAVRPGPPPWARLPTEELEHPLPSFLILVSRDGAAKGVARIDDLARHAHEPLFVEVRELAALAGSVRFEGPAPPDCELRLWSSDADETGDPLGFRWLARTEEATPFLFQGLAPGPYRLELRADGIEPRRIDVRVPCAAPLELVVLGVERVLHVLAGRITSVSGLPFDGRPDRPELWHVLAHQDGGDGRGSGQVTWNGGVGTFEIGGLPEGEYRLHPQFRRGRVEIEPDSPRALVPGPPVELRARDGVALERFELWITAPEPARELTIDGRTRAGDRITGWLEPEDPLEDLANARPAQRVSLGPYPVGALLEIQVSGEGLRSARLGPEDFVQTGEVWRAEVELVAGWSAHLYAYDEARAALTGIVLAFDGVPLSPTDTAGQVRADLDAKPARVSVVTPGWELVEHHSWEDWGTVFASGEFTLEAGILDVFLRRTR